jgi:hypothetical protein
MSAHRLWGFRFWLSFQHRADDQRLVAIIWAACWRLVSVTLAPESIRATS